MRGFVVGVRGSFRARDKLPLRDGGDGNVRIQVSGLDKVHLPRMPAVAFLDDQFC